MKIELNDNAAIAIFMIVAGLIGVCAMLPTVLETLMIGYR